MSQTWKRYGTIAVAGMLLSFSACSDSDGDPEGVSASVGPDGTNVEVDAQTAQLALDDLTRNVDITVSGFGSMNGPAAAAGGVAADDTASVSGEATPSGGEGQINVTCAAGGAASVGGYVNVVPAPVMVDVKVAITYDGCVTNTGNTIAGDVEFSQSAAVGPGTPLRVETLYRGDIEFTGKINAKCPVDLNVLVDETGHAIETGGTFCGQEASNLNLQISPRWSASGSVTAK